MQDHGGPTAEFVLPDTSATPDWLDEARMELSKGRRYLLWRSGEGEIQAFEVEHGWTRIGRSVSADVQLDDPSVSRRHALLVSEPRRALRVLDDRSLNGVFINGKLAEWGKLEDGDELTIGRFHIFALDT
ncbi:MAG TPA: FHA domain-containing protein [Solirubrobacterales bacterium]|jgi:hypothetical protein